MPLSLLAFGGGGPDRVLGQVIVHGAGSVATGVWGEELERDVDTQHVRLVQDCVHGYPCQAEVGALTNRSR